VKPLRRVLLDWILQRHSVVEKLRIEELVVGMRYCAAKVSGEQGDALGFAYVDYLDCFTFPPPEVDYSNIYNTIIRGIESPNLIERTIAIALINAVSQYLLWREGEHSHYRVLKANLVEVVAETCRGSKSVIVVGNMGPIVRALNSYGIEVTVLERSPLMRWGAYPDISLLGLSKRFDAAIITGVTLVNETIDLVLQKLKDCRIKILVGPTAGVHPEIAVSLGIDLLASLRADDMDSVLRCVKLGGGRWHFAKYCTDYIIDLRSSGRGDRC